MYCDTQCLTMGVRPVLCCVITLSSRKSRLKQSLIQFVALTGCCGSMYCDTQCLTVGVCPVLCCVITLSSRKSRLKQSLIQFVALTGCCGSMYCDTQCLTVGVRPVQDAHPQSSTLYHNTCCHSTLLMQLIESVTVLNATLARRV